MTFNQFLRASTYTVPIELIIGVVIGALVFRRLNGAHKLLFYFILASLVLDILGRLFAKAFENNLMLIPYYGLVELIVFNVLYLHHFKIGHWVMWMPFSIAAAFIGFELYALDPFDTANFHSYARVISGFSIVVLTLLCYVHYLRKAQPLPSGIFLLNTTVLIFFSTNLVFFLPINFLINEHSNLKFYFWAINLLLTIGFYFIIIQSIWKNGKILKQ